MIDKWGPPPRVVARVAKFSRLCPSGCVEWMGYRAANGYGRFAVDSRSTEAHRVTYVAWRGLIPRGYHLDHLCRNRACVNPWHLEPVTTAENTRRGNGGKHWSERTRCPRGHEYSPENTYVTRSGTRDCRTCRRERPRYAPTGNKTNREACNAGHRFAPENVYVDKFGHRHCRKCKNMKRQRP